MGVCIPFAAKEFIPHLKCHFRLTLNLIAAHTFFVFAFFFKLFFSKVVSAWKTVALLPILRYCVVILIFSWSFVGLFVCLIIDYSPFFAFWLSCRAMLLVLKIHCRIDKSRLSLTRIAFVVLIFQRWKIFAGGGEGVDILFVVHVIRFLELILIWISVSYLDWSKKTKCNYINI